MAVILGLDPGLATMGFGVIRGGSNQWVYEASGVIRTSPHQPAGERLHEIQRDLEKLIRQYHPDLIGMEELFFSKNVTNALKVAQARGVALASIAARGLSVLEFTPSQVKQNLCGYGQAKKVQVQEMVRRLLRLKTLPRPDDAADALAVALCTAQASFCLLPR